MGHPFLGARIAKEETILDPKFDVSPHSYARPAGRPAGHVSAAVYRSRCASRYFPPYVRVVLFVCFSLFSLCFCFGALVYGRHACVTIPVALQYARLVGTKLHAVVKSE